MISHNCKAAYILLTIIYCLVFINFYETNLNVFGIFEIAISCRFHSPGSQYSSHKTVSSWWMFIFLHIYEGRYFPNGASIYIYITYITTSSIYLFSQEKFSHKISNLNLPNSTKCQNLQSFRLNDHPICDLLKWQMIKH